MITPDNDRELDQVIENLSKMRVVGPSGKVFRVKHAHILKLRQEIIERVN